MLKTLPEPTWPRLVAGVLVAALVVFAGASCTGKFYKKWADKETYRIVQEKQEAVLGERVPFTIEPGKSFRGQFALRSAQDLIGTSARPGEVGGEGKGDAKQQRVESQKIDMAPLAPEGALKLSLMDCLKIVMATSRDYQNQKEQLYLSALSLSLARHEWTPIFSTTVSGDMTRSGDKDNRVNTAAGSALTSVAQKILTGAEATVSLSLSASRVVSEHAQSSVTAVAAGNVVQPLLKGAGSRVAREGLKQSERDVIYAARRFRRFQETFTIQVVTEYFRVLQQEDQIKNQWDNYNNLRLSTSRFRSMFDAGRQNRLQLAQAQLQELRAYDRWVSAVQRYYTQLDRFKVRLGLEPDANIILDRQELARVGQGGLQKHDKPISDAINTALSKRLDLMTTRDQTGDAERKVHVAKYNAILPQLNLEGSYTLENSAPNDLARYRTHEAEYSYGLTLNPGLDRKAERNEYRSALITLERRKRDLEDGEDSVKLEVLQAWRNTRQAESTYDIQRESVRLAEEQVDNARELLRAGRAIMRDVLEAEEGLLNAKNSLTGAIVDHLIARLEFERDIGTLPIDHEGFLSDERIRPKQRP